MPEVLWLVYLATLIASVVRRYFGLLLPMWIKVGVAGLIRVNTLVIILLIFFLLYFRTRYKKFWAYPLFVFGFWLILLWLEKTGYPNFIYSIFGFTPSFLLANSLFWVVVVLFVSIVPLFKHILMLCFWCKSYLISNCKDWQLWLVIGSVIYLFVMAFRANELIRFKFLDYTSVIGTEYEYIKVLASLDQSCPIIHPPYDMKFPEETRWPNLRNQPILQYFLYPKVLINGEAFIDKMYLEKIKKFPCFYFLNIKTLGQEWPSINGKKISFDRYKSDWLEIKSQKVIINGGQFEVRRVELNL